jgi:hypothetical protein
VDLAALAAMVGAGHAGMGKAAPPLSAINLEDLGENAFLTILSLLIKGVLAQQHLPRR